MVGKRAAEETTVSKFQRDLATEGANRALRWIHRRAFIEAGERRTGQKEADRQRQRQRDEGRDYRQRETANRWTEMT